jgi:hypothetical protein
VISYIVLGALSDAFPVQTNFNQGAAIVQVIFIYIIEMVSLERLFFFFVSSVFVSNVIAVFCPPNLHY